MKERYNHPWSQIRFYVAGDDIVFADSITGTYISARPQHQSVLEIKLEPIAREAASLWQKGIRRREPATVGHIDRHRYVVRKEWVVGGTRIPVWIIQDLHEAGYSTDQILHEYPILTSQDIEATLAFVVDSLDVRVR